MLVRKESLVDTCILLIEFEAYTGIISFLVAIAKISVNLPILCCNPSLLISNQGVLAEILEPIMGKGLIPADLDTWKQRRRGNLSMCLMGLALVLSTFFQHKIC